MTRKAIAVVMLAFGLAAFFLEKKLSAQSDLKVTYGGSGVQLLSYKGVVLEDLNQYGSDAFHIWHMKMTDLGGNVLSNGQYGWGESNNGRNWDAATQTWTYTFSWGSIRVQFAQSGNTLNMNVTEANSAGSGVILDGAAIYPFALHFPELPNGFYNSSYPQLAFNTTGPSVTVADYGKGEVVAVVPDAAKPLYSGFEPAGPANAYTPIISGTALDGMATFQPHNDRPVAPGQTDTFTVSLRFAPSGTGTSALASDAYQSWAQTWPPQIHWTDHRAIGTVYLASSPQGNAGQPAGYPNNPRRYFNDSNAGDFDVRTPAGLAAFQSRILQQAASNVHNLQMLNAQGAITWDIEGEQYPQDTSYVCEPDEIAQIAPEMESTVADTASPYAGIKLDDAYFKTMRDAGFRIGVCVRPQHFTLGPGGTAGQQVLPDAEVAAELTRKMKYAHDRWGATLFYVDSTVDANGAPLDAGIFQQVAAALSDSLVIPEETTPKDYAYTAAFKTFLFHGDLGTDPSVYNYYPQAFSANLINDVDASKLAAAIPQITAAVRHGDILMAHVDYWQANDPTIVQIYKEAGGSASNGSAPPPPAPVPAPSGPGPASPGPSPASPGGVEITAPGSNAALSGNATVTAQVNVSLDAAGSYLMVDGTEIGTRRVTGAPYNYALDSTTLTNGQHTLQVWAHDTANQVVLSNTVEVEVANTKAAAPAPAPVTAPVATANPSTVMLTYPRSGQAVSGAVSVTASISQTLDAAGSYLMVDGAEVGTRRVVNAPYLYDLDTSLLSAGEHVLQVWAHDIANQTLLSSPVIVTITGP